MVSAGGEDSSSAYDVFLSFRGEDTRFGFTKNLHTALVQKKVNAFMDVVNLGKGEEIDDALLGAIDRSKIAIVVFSEHYADSSWCLGELARIIQRKDQKKMTVIPVFYSIEPTITRKQEKSYATAMAAHEVRFKDEMEKVQLWRAALRSAASISGWDNKNVYEVDLIQGIVEDVAKKLKAFRTEEILISAQPSSRGHMGKKTDKREKRVPASEKSAASFDWSDLAAATAAKASSKVDTSGRRAVSATEKDLFNWKDMAAAAAAAAATKMGN